MKLRLLSAATMVLALSVCATTVAVAQPFAFHNPVHAKFGKTKTVSFSLRNDSKSPIKLMAGSTAMTLAPGATTEAKLPVGEKITVAEATSTRAAGDVIATVSSELSGNTIALR